VARDLDPRDLDVLERAVNDAAGRASVLWTSFITLGTYLLVATGSVKHRDLFLDAPIKLPVLSVDLPVTGYFLVAPLIFVIFHSYVLLQLDGLSKRAADYTGLLTERIAAEADRQMMRHRLDNFAFLQFLAGSEERRVHYVGGLQGLISWVTVVAFPLVVLLQLQIAFLPVHSSVTWLHRACIAADLAMVWTFWRRVSHYSESPLLIRLPIAVAGGIGTVAFLLFSICLASYPGERVYRNPVASAMDASVSFATRDRVQSVSRLLFEGTVNGVTGQPDSLFANRVILPGERFFDEAKHAKAEISVSLRGRDLQGAILQRTDLRSADFTGAKLVEASFVGARLEGARFGCASRVEVEVSRRLRQRPRAEACDDDRAADLRGADFTEAALQGAWFDHAKLQGARLIRAMMQGASLREANLIAATLSYARLEGASLGGANLFGVSLLQAQMQGVDLGDADLSSAALLLTQLQGADLRAASLTNAALNRANLYRAFIDIGEHEDTNFTMVVATPRFPRLARGSSGQGPEGYGDAKLPERLDSNGYKELVRRALEGIPEERTKLLVRKRLEGLDPRVIPDKETQLVRERPIQSDAGTNSKVRRQRAEDLAEVMCKGEDVPYVARGFIYNGRILGAGDQAATLVATLRSESCAGAVGLQASDWAELQRIERQAANLKGRRQQTAEEN
jgi:uncharacterized protein YjbI with pentapeptide repeats